jgi:predicted TIM-barrel fold metal-dependent hydrolase
VFKISAFVSTLLTFLLNFSPISLTNDYHVQIKPAEIALDETAMVEKVIEMRKKRKESQSLSEVYSDLKVIDVHSHDARAPLWSLWKAYSIDKTVLFGNVSEPEALITDRYAWREYEQHPTLIYPSFAGVPLAAEGNGLEIAKENLEKGYLMIGELYVASTYSPHANVSWKAEHPYWGILPEVYELAEKYDVPIMVHIDPPTGKPIALFEKALQNHPNTTFIFAHGNVFNSPENLENLLSQYDNLIIDFFAGFTRYNEKSSRDLEDFVPLIEAYPNKFILGGDSGVEIGNEKTFQAMYELIDMLSATTAVKIAHLNFEKIIERQTPTFQQIQTINTLVKRHNISKETYYLNKRMANELIFELQKK